MTETGLAAVDALVSARGGLVARTSRLDARTGHEQWHVAGADLGDLSAVLSEVRHSVPRPSPGVMNGAGTDRELRRAARLAVAESLERYAACVWHDLELVRSSQDELVHAGEHHVDLSSLARVSSSEAASSSCPLVPPDPTGVLRWVRGVDLVSGESVLVPAVCVFLYIAPESLAERIWLPITTGCAVHTDPVAAVLNALLEVVEREAIATTWLQRMPLPRIAPESLEEDGRGFVERDRREGLQTTLIDATTDVGAPTVYCLSRRMHAERSQLVTCATATDPQTAALKALREASSTWIAVDAAPPAPQAVEEFHDVMHGAVHMAHRSRATAFDFLEGGPAGRPLEAMPTLPSDPSVALRLLVSRLTALGQRPVAVDLTTDEAARAGLRAVRVVVPGLVPLSFVPAAQFRGTQRLYSLPAALGVPSHAEEELNPWPQPFA